MAAPRPRAQRPTGTRAARRAPGAVAALLIAGALAGAPAPAPADPNGEHAGGGRDGAAPAAQAQPAPPAPPAAPEAPAAARQDRESKAEAPVVPAPQVAASGITDGAGTGIPAPSGGGSGRGGRSRPQSTSRDAARRPAAPRDAGSSSASGSGSGPGTATLASAGAGGEPATATAAAASPAAAPASAPAGAPTSPSSTSARSDVARRQAAARRRARARARARAARRAAAGGRTVADRRRGQSPARALAPAGTVIADTIAVSAPARRPAPASSPAAPAGEPRESAITRTVVQVLEVIPLRLRIALAGLAALGVVLGAAALVQARRLRRLERQRGRLAADVGVLQSALLPELPARIGGAKVTAAYRPAEGLAGGGDFFDGFELPDGRTAILVGDVAGHGRDVVPVTALVRYSLRAYLEAGLEPRAALAVASDVLGPQLDGRLVTVAVAIFDPAGGRLTFACAGHWPPGLLGVPSVPVRICSSPPLGAGVPTGRRQTTLGLPPGAAACLHTDGLADVLIGPDRLGMDGLAAQLEAIGPEGDARELLDRIVGLSDQQPDDMAVCLLTALPGGGSGGGPRLEVLEADLAMLRGTRVERFLEACGVDAPGIAAALAGAHELAARGGTAVLEVSASGAQAAVRVVPPAPAALPVGRPDAPPALAAAG